MSEKLCVFCDHFGWSRPIPEYDGTIYGGMACEKGMLNVIRFDGKGAYFGKPRPDYEVIPEDTEDFRKIIRSAEKCPHYSPPEKP